MANTAERRRHILLAEDDPSIADIVMYILKENEYQVTVPGSYDHLSDLIQNSEFDLILLDLKLWGTDTTGLCKKIKSDEKTKSTPLVLMTASSEIRSIAVSAGADDIVEKPFDITDLLNKIKNHLG